jgi:hypothetical protein
VHRPPVGATKDRTNERTWKDYRTLRAKARYLSTHLGWTEVRIAKELQFQRKCVTKAISEPESYDDNLGDDERFIGDEFRWQYGSGSGLRGRSAGAGAGALGCNVSGASSN